MYHPLLNCLSVIIDKNINILYIDKDVKRVFTPRPTESFLSARKLNSYLVTANLFYFERTVGSYKSKSKRCRDCNNITEADSFVCSNDQTNFKINHRFVCNERSLIYLITCNRCLKQYLGKTTDEFRQRWKNYKHNERKFEKREHCMQRHLYVDFNLLGHSGFLDDVSVTIIDTTYSKNSTKEKDCWIHTFKTKTPLGLNVEDGF